MRVVQFGKMCLIGRTDIDYPCRRSLHRWPAPSSSRWQVGKVEGFNVGPGPSSRWEAKGLPWKPPCVCSMEQPSPSLWQGRAASLMMT